MWYSYHKGNAISNNKNKTTRIIALNDKKIWGQQWFHDSILVKLNKEGFKSELLKEFLYRLLRKTNFDNYDKDNSLLLRKVLYYCIKVPILGRFLAKLLKNIFMLQTLPKKII